MSGIGQPSPGYISAFAPFQMPAAAPVPAPPPDFSAMAGNALSGGPAPTAPIMLGGQPVTGPAAPPPLTLGGQPLDTAPAPPPADGGMSAMPPAAPLASSGATPAPPTVAPSAAPTGPRPFLHQVYGGGTVNVAAKETELRGPTLRNAQADRNAAFEGAAAAVTERAQQTAAGDFAIALEQERKAGVREDAANYTAAERADEMAQRQADFDQSVKAMGDAGTIDNSRFFSNAGTGQKLAMMVSLLVGGLAEAKGARNTGAEAIKMIAANDVKAQEFAYNATRDTANAKQTAFSMAMQKFNNADAARAAARAASMDVLTAQLAKQAALWKGTEAQNRASIAIADLQNDRMNQIQAGVAFAPGRQVAQGRQFMGADGLMYSEQEAKGLSKEMRTQGFELEKQGAGIEGQLKVEGAKGGQKDDKELGVETRAISSQLQQAGVPQARAAAETALAALNKDPGGKLEALDRAVTPDAISHAAHSDSSNAREQAYSKFSNAAVKAIMGNATEAERARMVEDLGRASDPESRRRAIKNVLVDLEAIEKNAHAGASPGAQEAFKKRRELAEGAPPIAPKGASAGWGGTK